MFGGFFVRQGGVAKTKVGEAGISLAIKQIPDGITQWPGSYA